MDNLAPFDETERIAQQRFARRDTLLPDQPNVRRVERLCTALLSVHMGFCAAVLVLGTLSSSGKRLIEVLVYPLDCVVFSIYPGYLANFGTTPTPGAIFVRAVTAETFFVTAVTLFAYQWIYIARYWRRPWRFNDFFMEQQGFRRNVFTACVSAAIALPLALAFGYILGFWFGFVRPDMEPGLAKPFQIALWSILMPGTALAVVIGGSLGLSSIFAAVRGTRT